MNTFATQPEPTTLNLVRILPGPIERVWAYITEPEKRAKWFAGGPMELKADGALELRFKHSELSEEQAPVPEQYAAMAEGVTVPGKVFEVEAPHKLVFMWGGPDDQDRVTFDLSTEADGRVRLEVTHVRLNSRRARVQVASGWHVHLQVLEDVLEGRAPKAFWPAAEAAAAEYEARLPQED